MQFKNFTDMIFGNKAATSAGLAEVKNALTERAQSHINTLRQKSFTLPAKK